MRRTKQPHYRRLGDDGTKKLRGVNINLFPRLLLYEAAQSAVSRAFWRRVDASPSLAVKQIGGEIEPIKFAKSAVVADPSLILSRNWKKARKKLREPTASTPIPCCRKSFYRAFFVVGIVDRRVDNLESPPSPRQLGDRRLDLIATTEEAGRST